MNPKNDYIRDFLGVTAWHNAGYTGKRVKIACGENFITEENNPYYNHAITSVSVAHEILPDCEIIYTDWGNPQNIVDAVKNKNISIMFLASHSSNNGAEFDKVLAPVLDRFKFFAAAGNQGTAEYSELITAQSIIGVGAYEVGYTETINGKPTANAKQYILPLLTSSPSEFVDFSSLSGVYAAWDSTFVETSCGVTVLAAQLGLVDDLSIEKTGKPLSFKMAYQFLEDYSHDFEDVGKDDKTGWGYVVLPDPNTFDIKKYQPDYILSNELDLTKNELLNIDGTGDNPSFWAIESTEKMKNIGIFNGDGIGNFGWQQPITREAIAVVLYNLMKKYYSI